MGFFLYRLKHSGLIFLLTGLITQPSVAAVYGPFFNHQESSSYADPYRGIVRSGSDLESHVVNAIESAQRSVDLAVQELRLPRVAQALAKVKERGLRVRVVLDNKYHFSIDEHQLNHSLALLGSSDQRFQEYFNFVDMNGDGHLSAFEISQRDAIAILRQNQVPIIDDTADGSLGTSLMHHKFLVVDEARVVVTSANLTMSDVHGDYSSDLSRGNANALMIFNHPNIVRAFQREFDILWGQAQAPAVLANSTPRFGMQKPYRGAQRIVVSPTTSVSVQFSPTPVHLGYEASTNGLIDRTLKRAQTSVNMALFVFSEQAFANTLDDLRRRFPLNIKALVEATFAFQWYSEILDMLGLELYGPGCVQDQGNQIWNPAISSVGVPKLDPGDFLHHKFAVIDGRITIFGSQNWSSAANSSNDENLLIIEDLKVARLFEEEFARLYSTAELGITDSLRQKIDESRQACEN